MACLQPFFRGHAEITTKRREPYLLSEKNQERVRVGVRLRYTLMPYIYTLFWHDAKDPVFRPLLWHYPSHPQEDSQFLLGESILVAPVLEEGATSKTVILPEQTAWFDWYTGEHVPNVNGSLDTLPVYVKWGSIIPTRERWRRSTTAQSNDPYTLIVVLDRENSASGELFMDDGRTFDQSFTLAYFSVSKMKLKNTVKQTSGRYDLRIERIRVWRMGFRQVVIKSPGLYTGKEWEVDLEELIQRSGEAAKAQRPPNDSEYRKPDL